MVPVANARRRHKRHGWRHRRRDRRRAPLDVGLTDPPPRRRLRDSGSPREPRDRSRPTGLFLAVGAGAAVAFGFGIELLQAPIPWRSFAWSDAAVNAIGAVVGLVAVVAVNAIGAIVATAERRPR